MPGLFDDNNDLGNGILGTLFSGVRRYQMQQQGLQSTYNSLRASGLSDDEARAATLNPQAAGEIWQRKIFQQQFEALRNSPGPDGQPLGDAAAYGILTSPEAAKSYYGYQQLKGPELGGGVSFPGPTIHGGGIQGPPQIAGQPAQQPQPTQQPAAQQPQPQGPQAPPGYEQYQPLVDYASRIAAQRAGAIKSAEAGGAMQPGFPAALNKAHQTIAVLQSIIDHPDLDKVTGRVAGGLPARYSVNPDLVNTIESANSMLLNDTLTASRNISGRPVNAGTLKEIRPFDLVKDRLGSADGLRDDARRAIQTIKDETDAAWVGANSPPEFKPVWEKSQTQQAPSMPQVGEIRKGHKFLGGNPADPRSWQKQQTM